MNINPVEVKDPTFVPKVHELITKVALIGVGHTYGCGLGILEYASKLNKYRDYNLSKWESNFQEGVFMFL